MSHFITKAGPLLAILLAGPALAQSDADLLAGLPDEADTGALPAESDGADRPDQRLRWHFDANVTGYDRRQPLPDPQGSPPNATGRARLVAEGGFALGSATTFRLNAALSGRWNSGAGFDAGDDLRLDLREAYLLHEQGRFVIEAGRINIRNGVALGYNPTDFFRALNADQSPNLDPSEARLNRLGVVALRAGYLWDSGAVSLTYAPEITGGSDWLHDREVWGLNLNATNPRDRFLFSYTQELAEGIAPELFLFSDDGDLTGGLAVSASLGDRWLAYGEVTRGKGRRILDTALNEARENGRVTPAILREYGDGEGKQMLTRAALGLSYSSASNMIVTAEYHYNEAGFDGGDWDRYFDLAEAVDGNRAASGQLASMFLYGAYLQEPVSKHSLFLRVVQNEMAGGRLTLSGLSNISLADRSASVQVEAAYEITDGMVVTGRLGGNFGDRRSDFGSRSNRTFATIGLERHF